MQHVHRHPFQDLHTKANPNIMFTHKIDDNGKEVTVIYHKRPKDRKYDNITEKMIMFNDELFAKFTIEGSFYPLGDYNDEFAEWLAEDHAFLLKEGIHVAKVKPTDFFVNGSVIIRTNQWHLTNVKQDVLTEIVYEAIVLEKSKLLTPDDIEKLSKKYVELGIINNSRTFMDKYDKIKQVMCAAHMI
ncbi:hypothetical protein J7J90_03695 [Candidatus Micrarchaeota archaeon]|nr:hypothetical protein [Candidatus Micrarchaeota archaeon]